MSGRLHSGVSTGFQLGFNWGSTGVQLGFNWSRQRPCSQSDGKGSLGAMTDLTGRAQPVPHGSWHPVGSSRWNGGHA